MLVKPFRKENRRSWEMRGRRVDRGTVVSASMEVAWGEAVGRSGMGASVEVGGGGGGARLQAEKTRLDTSRERKVLGWGVSVCSSCLRCHLEVVMDMPARHEPIISQSIYPASVPIKEREALRCCRG